VLIIMGLLCVDVLALMWTRHEEWSSRSLWRTIRASDVTPHRELPRDDEA